MTQGVVQFMNNGSMYRLDGDLYGGVLPAVQVIGKRGKNDTDGKP